jgi:hypothetical protein
MVQKKTIHERQQELRSLLATAAGREELEGLASRYHAAGDRPRPPAGSIITYILIHEREEGLIGG